MAGAPGPVLVHASCVALGAAARPFRGPEEAAVLLLGEAGSGKSDLALRLIAAGARLIADDQTRLTLVDDRLFAQSPERIAGLMELRGIGIVRLETAPGGPVALAARLVPGIRPKRLPEPEFFVPAPLAPARPPPLIGLDPFAPSAPARIAAAASAIVTGRIVAGVAPGNSS